MKPSSFATPKVAIPEVTRFIGVVYLERRQRHTFDISGWLFSKTSFASVGMGTFIITFIFASREHQSATWTMFFC